MRRIKLVLATLVVLVAALAAFSGPAMAQDDYGYYDYNDYPPFYNDYPPFYNDYYDYNDYPPFYNYGDYEDYDEYEDAVDEYEDAYEDAVDDYLDYLEDSSWYYYGW